MTGNNKTGCTSKNMNHRDRSWNGESVGDSTVTSALRDKCNGKEEEERDKKKKDINRGDAIADKTIAHNCNPEIYENG